MSETHGIVYWSELSTTDAAAARAFYEKTAGWTYEDWNLVEGVNYTVCMAGDKPVAGIFEMSGPEFAGVPAHWMTYIAVDDVDAVAEGASANGAEVVRAPYDVPTVGRIVMIKDPTGAVIGYMTPVPHEH